MAKQIIPDNAISDFLNRIIFESSFVSINFWSVIHLFSGAILFAYLKDPLKVFLLLVLYELLEFLLWGVMFKQETYQDIIWDLIIGMIGAGLVYLAKIYL